MKKYLLSFVAFCFIIGAYNTPAHAISGSVGATGWFTWWKMTGENKSTEITPFMLYGPVFSVNLPEKFSISGVALFGC